MNDNLLRGRHIVLYAKGQYHRSLDVMTDMRHLVAKYTFCNFQDVTDKDVLAVVSDVVIPLILGGHCGGDPERLIKQLLSDLLNIATRGNFLTTADVVAGLLSPLRTMKIKEGDKVLINLGEPDFNILPAPK